MRESSSSCDCACSLRSARVNDNVCQWLYAHPSNSSMESVRLAPALHVAIASRAPCHAKRLRRIEKAEAGRSWGPRGTWGDNLDNESSEG